MLKRWVSLIALSVACAHAHAELTPGVQYDNKSLQELQELQYLKGMTLSGDNDLAEKRNQAMRDAALSVGAQNGYVSEMNRLRKDINAEAVTLDGFFAFKDLMRIATPGEKSLYFLPAVIHESNEVTAHSPDNNRILVSGKYYQIIKKERLVTNPPDWREYLLIDIPVDVSQPVGALLPKTPAEQALWSDWVAEGWETGVLQANAEMSARVRNLGSDFIGMVKYLRLVKEGKVTPSYVASQYRGSVNQGNSMHVDQRTFAITGKAAFNGNSDQWLPLNLDPRGSYRTPDEIREINRR
ncbi:type IV secretory system conjugative DNA transfer family protein (plasmid) [Pseudomonas sp. FeN3W]|nr:type IV secretory system conjugative DNA transfer family protein [Pseudomonas sp. FeN3W]